MTDLPHQELTIEQPSVDAAIRRLTAALNELEAVVERRQENDRGQDNLAARIQALGADRSRLADELDISVSRARSLEDANRHVSPARSEDVLWHRLVVLGAEGSRIQEILETLRTLRNSGARWKCTRHARGGTSSWA